MSTDRFNVVGSAIASQSIPREAVHSGLDNVPGDPMSDALADQNDGRRHPEMFPHFRDRADVAIPRQDAGQDRQQGHPPDQSPDRCGGPWENRNNQHEAQANQQACSKIRDRPDEHFVLLQALRFLIHVNAEGIGQIVSHRRNQQRAHHAGFSRVSGI